MDEAQVSIANGWISIYMYQSEHNKMWLTATSATFGYNVIIGKKVIIDDI